MRSIDNNDGLIMRTAKHSLLETVAASASVSDSVRATHVGVGSPRRQEAERFIRSVFHRHHDAFVRSFAPNLLLLEQEKRVVAAVGWRGADREALFLERYLDQPVEILMERLTGQMFSRERVVEVGHLASEKPGGSVQVIVSLARHLALEGYEWVVFTATRELVRIFTRLGLPLLALAKADPARLGAQAGDWGRYYDAQPVVVAGPIRLALERTGGQA